MSIGTGIVLLVIGAILTFATNFVIPGVNLVLIGQILMGAGAIVTIIGIVLATRKRQSITTVRSSTDPANGENVAQRSTSTTNGFHTDRVPHRQGSTQTGFHTDRTHKLAGISGR